jgi:GDP-mannose 6-dehydrogenase
MLTTQIRTAEMLKMACNAFHALKITFANEIGRIAQSCSVDSHAVMKLVCQDTRLNISAAYMRPGFAFGGSCLPKDLRALTYLARTKDVHTPLLGSLLASNRVHIDHALDVIMKQGRRRVAMVGLAFKTGTDDLRESPLVTMAKRLLGEGYSLRIYDPDVHLSSLIGANRRYIEDNIPHIGSMLDDSLTETIANSDTIVLGLGTPSLAQAIVEQSRPDQHVLDLVNMEGREKLRASYTGVCW